ncbi:MAG: sigma-54 dependent transcriptional regulator [Candidatus Eisenbacteria bacterium]|jgi:DNA-binding NtrC family response regulator|nr:sigma-54 dependent transcriptional regulator [Candidatus Eisenbacteria bacterium]
MAERPPIIVVASDDDDLAERLVRALRSFSVERAASPSDLWLRVRDPADLIILDARLAPNAETVLRRRLAMRERPPEILTIAGDDAAGGLSLDADDERFAAEVFARVHRRRILERTGLIGHSTSLLRIAELILQAAPTPVTVLIEGESGTGKELVARAVHRNSKRAEGPFVVVNCAALAEGVLESELFGHERGSFTGAAARRQGMFELAHGGTVFLDEIGEMTAATQVKLLRVLEEKEFMRVGGSSLVRSDARVVAATNRNLAHEVDAGRFRQDLYFRICVVRIELPPLRDRIEDIEPLFWHFVRQISGEIGRDPPVVSRLAVEQLESYAWPGNVRELRNFVERLVVMGSPTEIRTEDVQEYLAAKGVFNPRLPVVGRRGELPLDVILDALLALRREVADLRRDLERRGLVGQTARSVPVSVIEDAHELPLASSHNMRPERVIPSMEQVERETIEHTLREAGGNRRQAARLLGIGERTLYRKIQRFNLQEVR